MKLRVKWTLLALSAGMVAFGAGTCLFRWLGDIVGDALWLRVVD